MSSPSSLVWPPPTAREASRRTSAGSRLISPLTTAEQPPTPRALVRSLALPSSRAAASNVGGGDRFSGPYLHGRCCLRRYTGDSTTPFPDSPRNHCPGCHDGVKRVHFRCGPRLCPCLRDWVTEANVSGLLRRGRVAPPRWSARSPPLRVPSRPWQLSGDLSPRRRRAITPAPAGVPQTRRVP